MAFDMPSVMSVLAFDKPSVMSILVSGYIIILLFVVAIIFP